MPTNISPKVYASAGTGLTAGAAVSFLLVWALNKYANAGIDAEVASVISSIISPLVGAIGGYLAPHNGQPPAG